MNNKKSFLLSLIVVLVIGLIVTGSSFAYFQWSLGYASGTGVNVTIKHGGITMHIEPEKTEFVGLYPTADCTTNSRYGDALVTIVNNTGTLAIPSFKLKVRVLKNGTETLSQEDLSHIRYTVVPLKTIKNAQGKPIKGGVMNDSSGEDYSCSYPMAGKDSFADEQELFKNSTGYWTTQFKFESVATDGSWSSIPSRYDESYLGSGWEYLDADEYLPRQYYLADNGTYNKGDVNGITFRGEAYSTSYQYFRVYVWIDEGYTTTIIGNSVSDPLQNAKIEITWSEESMVQQVSGESITEPELAAGLYDANGNMTYTWAELIEEEYIRVNGTSLDYVERVLEGVLVIPSEITVIIGAVFSYGNISEVKFEKNSQLTTIETLAFEDNFYLQTIEIPASVTSIGEGAFSNCPLNQIYFEGTMEQWNAIEKGDYWWNTVASLDIVCSDGTITLKK